MQHPKQLQQERYAGAWQDSLNEVEASSCIRTGVEDVQVFFLLHSELQFGLRCPSVD